MSSAIRQTSNN